jgi:gas vesicle protein
MNDNAYTPGTVAGSSLAGFLMGAVAGAAIALLFAPDRGSVTRQRLAQVAKRVGSKARESAEELSHGAQAALDAGRQEFQQRRETSRHGA